MGRGEIMVNKIKKIRYVLKNKITGSIEYKYYYLEQIEKGIEKLFIKDPGKLCRLPYSGHPKGCPTWARGKNNAVK